jgi:thiol-disulfide isomerase/thioredoxin
MVTTTRRSPVRAFQRAAALLIALAAGMGGTAPEASAGPAWARAWRLPFAWLSFDDALARAAADRKTLLVYFTASGCEPCHEMERDTWPSPPVAAFLAARAVVIRADLDDDPELFKRFAVKAYPTLLVLRRDGAERDRIVGSRAPDELLAELGDAFDGGDALKRARAEVAAAVKGGGGSSAAYARRKLGFELLTRKRYDEAMVELFAFYEWSHAQPVRGPAYRAVYMYPEVSALIRFDGLARDYEPAGKALKARRDVLERLLLPPPPGKTAGSGAAAAPSPEERAAGPRHAAEVAALDRALGDWEHARKLLKALRARGDEAALDAAEMLAEDVAERYRDERHYAEAWAALEDLPTLVEREFEALELFLFDFDKEDLKKTAMYTLVHWYEISLGAGHGAEAEALAARIRALWPAPETAERLASAAERAKGK